MKERGIAIVYGRWLIEGAPRVLLIDTGTGYKYLDEWKGDLWNTAGIPSPSADNETNEAIVFGYLVAWFLGEVYTVSDLLGAIGLLTQHSTLRTSAGALLSLTSTSGLRVSPSR
jgi:hypothetical protein